MLPGVLQDSDLFTRSLPALSRSPNARYLRIMSDPVQWQPKFMNLSTGRVDFSLPNLTGVFVYGWKLTLDGVDEFSLRWPSIQD